MTQVIQISPDTPTSLLDKFSTSKEGIISFSAKVINEVEAGNVDPLKAKIWCKTLQEIAEKIDKGTREYQNTEAAKYGEKPFSHAGAELHYTATYTAYDYSVCNDDKLNALNELKESIDKQIKERETFLKAINEHETVLNQETGEVKTIYPPAKKQTFGVKCTIK